MKLFVFRPKSFGPLTLMVAAEHRTQAIIDVGTFIEAKLAMKHDSEDHICDDSYCMLSEIDFDGYPNKYDIEEYEPGIVAIHPND